MNARCELTVAMYILYVRPIFQQVLVPKSTECYRDVNLILCLQQVGGTSLLLPRLDCSAPVIGNSPSVFASQPAPPSVKIVSLVKESSVQWLYIAAR